MEMLPHYCGHVLGGSTAQVGVHTSKPSLGPEDSSLCATDTHKGVHAFQTSLVCTSARSGLSGTLWAASEESGFAACACIALSVLASTICFHSSCCQVWSTLCKKFGANSHRLTANISFSQDVCRQTCSTLYALVYTSLA